MPGLNDFNNNLRSRGCKGASISARKSSSSGIADTGGAETAFAAERARVAKHSLRVLISSGVEEAVGGLRHGTFAPHPLHLVPHVLRLLGVEEIELELTIGHEQSPVGSQRSSPTLIAARRRWRRVRRR